MLDKRTVHGMHDTPTWQIWHGMKQRCFNPNNNRYKYYGGRGITVCDRWLEFKNFYEDMGSRPDNLELDRIDNNGDYTPENCRWATHAENMQNRNYTVLNEVLVAGIFALKDMGYKLKDIAEELDISIYNVESVLYHDNWQFSSTND